MRCDDEAEREGKENGRGKQKKTEKNRVKRMHMPTSTTNKRVHNDGETPR
jgi:hypothetical protein